MNGYAFRAQHIPLNREVFLKVCDADSESKALFQEPQALISATGSAAATNLVRLFDAERLGPDFILMAMEFADGGNLLNAIKSGLGQAQAVRLGMEILHGVSALHSARLLHRDIKPANILLFCDGAICVPKVGDFGSVAALPDGENNVATSRHSALYVPPEGWEEPGRYGIRSDLYQVGIVLHEMVCGPLPYQESAYVDRAGKMLIKDLGAMSLADMNAFDRSKLIASCIARRASRKQILTMRPEAPYLSRSLKRIINKATSPDQEDRYSSAIEFIAALQRLDLPDWKPSDSAFLAPGWRGWDWRVDTKATPLPNVVISRKKPDSAQFRKWKSVNSLSEAFKTVEQFQE
jgi:serine/threonine protein kinase